jgi:DNA-binding response OmpR family regulator
MTISCDPVAALLLGGEDRVIPGGRFAALASARELAVDDHGAEAVRRLVQIGKLLFLLGRRREALAQAAAALKLCVAGSEPGLRGHVDACLAEDLLAPGWLAREDNEPTSDLVRTRVRAALRCVSAGTVCRNELVRIEIPGDRDHAFDRALLELALSVCAQRRQQSRLAAAHLRRAVTAAVACGADRDLIPELHQRLLEHGAAVVAHGSTLVIDMCIHEVRDGTRRVSLSSRLVLRRLLYAFAAAPSYHLSRDEIARTLWGSGYDPLRHASSVKSNIQRLRELLDGTHAVLQAEIDGYMLRLPPNTVLVGAPIGVAVH